MASPLPPQAPRGQVPATRTGGLTPPPGALAEQVRLARDVFLGRRSPACRGPQDTLEYLRRRLPLEGDQQAAHFGYALAQVFDLMGSRLWDQAESLVALLLGTAEEAALQGLTLQRAWQASGWPSPLFGPAPPIE